MPRVSVLLPVYNTRPEHLREAIDSILAQTFADFELLILNDCSTNANVEEVVKSYTDPRIVYAVNERNLGISPSRNRLLDMAQGEYLAVMDHDDISLPERFEKQVAFLDAHPDVGIVGCQVWNSVTQKDRKFPINDNEIKMALMTRCALCHPAVMIRASVLKEHGLRYEEMFSPAEDYALFCRMLKHTNFANLPETLFHYRNWKGNTSSTHSDRMTAADLGIKQFVRAEHPVLWAMLQAYTVNRWRYSVCGIPLFLKEQTPHVTVWKLFGVIPVLKVKERKTRFLY
jgi:glycosyltransferase involved in cell wall biosynthesis